MKNIQIKKKVKSSEQYGMTLLELVVSLGISAILVTVIVAFCSNIAFQYKEQKLVLDSSSKTTYLLQVFDAIKQGTSVRVRSDNKAIEVLNDSSSPTTKTIYYELENAVYKDVYEDSQYINSIVIANNYSVDFSLESDSSYLREILKIVITDSAGINWERKISLRDCDIVETY